MAVKGWAKVPGHPGVYKTKTAAGWTYRVVWNERVIEGGRTRTKQKTRSFAPGKYVLVDAVSGSSSTVGAREAAIDHKSRMDGGRRSGRTTDSAAETMTLGEFFDRWIARPTRKTGEARRATTIDNTRRSFTNWIAPTFAERPLRSISVSDIRDWDAMLVSKAKPSARNKAVRTLSSIMREAVREGLATSNPVDGLSAQDNVREITVDEVFTDQQISKLKAAIDDRYRLMVDLLSYGMRLGEVIGLRRDRVNLKGDVRIDRSVSEVDGQLVEGPPKTRNSYRTLPVAHLGGELQHHIGLYAQDAPDGYVFTSPRGEAPIRPNNWRDRVFYPALEAAKLPKVAPHALRHRIACDLADEGYTDVQIADWLGDSATTVAKVYRNVLVRNREKIAARLGERYTKAYGSR